MSRESATSDQVQRPRSRSWRHGRRSAAAHRQEREASGRLSHHLAGEFEDLQKAQARLEVIVPLSILLIMVLLYGLFNSLRDSILALAGIPFAVRRRCVALYFSGLDLSISRPSASYRCSACRSWTAS